MAMATEARPNCQRITTQQRLVNQGFTNGIHITLVLIAKGHDT